MPFSIRFIFCAALAGWILSSCAPGQNDSDEEKEPHFVLGQNRVNAMDYSGAVEAFQESLEVNPHSAQAHYQLAMLYDTKVPDPAAAIYHYQQYLKFDPDAPNAVIVTQRIEACKQELAADVLALPSASATQEQLEKLIEQNRQLQDEVDKWRAYYASQLTNPQPQNVSVASQTPVQNSTAQNPPVQNVGATHSTTIVVKPHTHTVIAGETAMAIARKYKIKLSALQAANPDVNLSKIRAGQILNLP